MSIIRISLLVLWDLRVHRQSTICLQSSIIGQDMYNSLHSALGDIIITAMYLLLCHCSCILTADDVYILSSMLLRCSTIIALSPVMSIILTIPARSFLLVFHITAIHVYFYYSIISYIYAFHIYTHVAYPLLHPSLPLLRLCSRSYS